MDFPTARHLLQRTGFGGTPAAIRRLTAKDPVVAAQIMVDTLDTGADAALPDWVDGRVKLGGTAERGKLDALGAWWFTRMLETDSPLGERLVYFWHQHFGTSAPDVPAALRGRWHRTLRKHAAGNFRDLLTAAISDPAILVALGQMDASKKAPVELFARALLERFALGAGQYDDADLAAVAAAFTGWQVDRAGRPTFVARSHDTGRRTFLGRTGKLGAADIVRILLEDDRAADHIAESMWRHFVSPTPDPIEVSRLGSALRDADYEIKPLLSALFTSEVMVQAAHRATLIKSPVELIVGLARVLYLDAKGPDLAWACTSCGTRLFEPPVNGWLQGTSQLTAETLDRRDAAAGRLLRGFAADPRTPLRDTRALATWLGQPSLSGGRARDEAVQVLLAAPPVHEPADWFSAGAVIRTLVLDPIFQLA